MDAYKKNSFAAGSQVTGDEYSVLSPNKSTYSHNTQYGLPPSYHGHKENQNQYKYFPNIVQDLLAGTEEWRNIQDIVKMTFKAL
jgi:hypothetical protein